MAKLRLGTCEASRVARFADQQALACVTEGRSGVACALALTGAVLLVNDLQHLMQSISFQALRAIILIWRKTIQAVIVALLTNK